jgi:hypothetical protein
MNTFYESTLVEQPMSNRIESNDEDYAVHPLGTFASSGVLAVDEAPTITSGATKTEKSVTGATNFIQIRPPLWHAVEMLEGFAGIVAVLYMLGAVAFGVALLFYTFSR